MNSTAATGGGPLDMAVDPTESGREAWSGGSLKRGKWLEGPLPSNRTDVWMAEQFGRGIAQLLG